METAHLLCDSDNFEDVISTLKQEGAELERELDQARAELAELWGRFDKQMEAEGAVERLRTALHSCYWATNIYDGNYTRACDNVATIAINALKTQDL